MRQSSNRLKQRRPDLDVEQILAWADAHHARSGKWPKQSSGLVTDAPREKWGNLDQALVHGRRCLAGGSSLAQLLAAHRGVRNCKALPRLEEERILEWADAHYWRTGQWPKATSGAITDAPGETWQAIDLALQRGGRGLPTTSTLAGLLADHRQVRNNARLPRLTTEQILDWARAHHARTGDWPNRDSGVIPEPPGETWSAVCHALSSGHRGLSAGTSLAQLLAAHFNVPNQADLPALTVNQILAWADAHFRRTGRWPKIDSGPIPDAPYETWSHIQVYLQKGLRGLPGGSSLARLLAARRGRRNHKALPKLSSSEILAWADAHYSRTGRWPTAYSGRIRDAWEETWMAVNMALQQGHRGLPGGTSLGRLLAEERGVRNKAAVPSLSIKAILSWIDAHHRRTGQWPTRDSGPVADAPGETWSGVDAALKAGSRGLPCVSSLARLVREHRGC
jgi:hypothetical protein